MIPYSGNPNGRYNTVIGANPLKISLYLPLGVAGRGRSHLKFLALVIPYSGMPPFCHPLGLFAGGRSHIKLVSLILPYSGNPKGRFDTVLALLLFPK